MLLLIACTGDVPDPPSLSCPESEGPAQLTLPADDAPHEEAVEWWYWTGHLVDDAERWYGFEQVVFVYRLGAYEATSVHMALTDTDADSFEFEVAYAHGELPEATTDGFVLEAEGATASGGGGADSLTGFVEGASWDLDLAGNRKVLQHGDGFHSYENGGYTWYYSRPRMTVAGTLTVGDEERTVSGQAWFDHQWGDLQETTDEGWDWFALQLDDGRELMLFLSLDGDLVGGSISDQYGTCELIDGEFEVLATETWTSPNTDCDYPMAWEVKLLDETFTVTPVRQDQELHNDYRTYWEGAVLVDGDATGRGYVEMAGRCN